LILAQKLNKLNDYSVLFRWFILPDTDNLVIGVVADYVRKDPHDSHSVGHKYVRSVVDGMNAVPVLLPALGTDSPLQHWLELVDGVLLTGAYSNVEPHHYDGEPSAPGTEHDPYRDTTCLPLIEQAIANDIPLLGLCRGFQEINVALGGSLHQSVHEVNGLMDHREDKSQTLDIQYGHAHQVTLEKNGYLHGAIQKNAIMVNSVHQQGIDRLADSLMIECQADDGLIEAFSLRDRKHFVLGVQWHPEWKVLENEDYQRIFACFARACSQRKSQQHANIVN